MNRDVYLGLGANLGERAANLEQALALLSARGVRVVRRSSFYETAPQDVLDQPSFLNMVVEVETALEPMELLAAAQGVEQEMGRQRIVDKGPRNIDIDVLLFGQRVIVSEKLTVPHPRMLERRFVLEPLLELSPALQHPLTLTLISGAISKVLTQDVRRTLVK